MDTRTAAERREAAQFAANTRWSRVKDRTKATQPGRDAAIAKYEPDPAEVPDPVQRQKMAVNAWRAHMIDMRRRAREVRKAVDALLDATGLEDAGSDGIDAA